MLISHTHHFIYTKTIKTAGTSVEIYFEDACLSPHSDVVRGHVIEQTITDAGIIGYRGPDPSGRQWYNHMAAALIRERIGTAIWDSYFKFCVIRNPFDRLVSNWWFTMDLPHRTHYAEASAAERRAAFGQWAVDHVAEIVDRDKYTINGEICVDYFARYERLLADIATICARVGYAYRPERLGMYKTGYRLVEQPLADYYDAATIGLVEATFGWELRHFGYGLAQ